MGAEDGLAVGSDDGGLVGFIGLDDGFEVGERVGESVPVTSASDKSSASIFGPLCVVL